jgi:transcriptional regulator with XRE-family HTH domain
VIPVAAKRNETPSNRPGVEIDRVKLKQLREERGLDRRQLGEAAGVTGAAIGTWESGKRWPTPGNLIALAAALGVEPGELRA